MLYTALSGRRGVVRDPVAYRRSPPCRSWSPRTGTGAPSDLQSAAKASLGVCTAQHCFFEALRRPSASSACHVASFRPRCQRVQLHRPRLALVSYHSCTWSPMTTVQGSRSPFLPRPGSPRAKAPRLTYVLQHLSWDGRECRSRPVFFC